MADRRAVRPEGHRALAYRPLPLWRLIDDGSPPEEPQTPSGITRGPTRRKPYRLPEPLDEFDPIYRQFAEHLGWHPRDVDRLEVWEAARLLGRPDGQPVVPFRRVASFKEEGAGGPAVLDGGGSSMGDDLQARRVAAAKGAGPPPDWT